MTTRKDTITQTDGMPDIQELKAMFLNHCTELFEVHVTDILAILEDSEEQVAKFSIGVAVDTSESQASVLTRLRFAKVTTDERTGMLGESPDKLLEDPTQPPLGGENGEIAGAHSAPPVRGAKKAAAKKKPAKKKAGKKKAGEPEQEPVNPSVN